MAQYRIMSGVHRCVAAREAGQTEVRAVVDRGSGLGPVEMIPLADLFSPKPAIGRWDRNRDFMVLVGMTTDPVQRDALPPVELVAASPRGVKYLTPLAGVILNPV
jgi:hypothetical protein